MQWFKKINPECLDKILRKLEVDKYMLRYREYLTLGEEICAVLPFKDYYTLKHGSWPNNLDKD
jgi:hypothetical protein